MCNHGSLPAETIAGKYRRQRRTSGHIRAHGAAQHIFLQFMLRRTIMFTIE
jgi:hypothetical protein